MDGYRTQSHDTTEAAERLQFAIWRAMTPLQKARMFARACSAARRLTMAGIRAQHPQADEHEVRMRMLARMLDRETMLAVYEWDPVAHGA
jgi:hypothetical protein